VSGAITPVLVAVSVDSGGQATRWVALAFALVTSIALAVDTTFNIGDRYRNRRTTALVLRREGAEFALRIGRYAGRTHADSLVYFMERVEELAYVRASQYLVDASTAKRREGASESAAGPGSTRS
jgi:hypothetical protein